ncbi:hypothetical protein EV189_3054 [Motilibacter rhizosphaerae]|uniref:Aminomethyltransferase folate-binding domain-containing protein n=1 Tax=Motilibacter rhizosphaerae TaxID=598652 RepID=A0A4Q7NSI0_9ACTN|nr:glycine cleavage T C-terminal barrel domain-containing protein [Motilibacter rhizosphaerae]RZS87620.1 hypothetical protein EV189_3054 [Motilibacter rhizosphaerae]
MSTSTDPSPLLALPGAVPAEGVDAGVAWHYGDPLREQRRLLDGEGWVDLSTSGVVRVTGPARLGWLDDLTSQALRGLPAGASTEALVLDPNGRVEHHLRLVDDGTSAWMVVEPGTAAALTAYLLRMRFWTEVEVEDATAAYAVVWSPGEPLPAEVVWRPAPGDPLGGALSLVPRAELAALPAAAGAPAGSWAHAALRVAAGVPRLGVDTDDRTIPHEVGWMATAVALDKGCYRGQETVARVHNLGKPPRRLVLLHLDGSAELPEPGTAVLDAGREVGLLTSVAQHAELGPVALALVKRSVDPAATLVAGAASAAQEVPALLLAAPGGGAGRRAQAGLRPA